MDDRKPGNGGRGIFLALMLIGAGMVLGFTLASDLG